MNPLHVLLGVSAASTAPASTAVISPYRAQARLYSACLRDSCLDADAATIHRFQGSERDVVVFDLVDAPPEDNPSRLTGGDVDLALRLTNVALSRSRGKVIVLADLELVRSRFGATAPVRRALDLCAERGAVVAPAPGDVTAGPDIGFFDWFGTWDAAFAVVAREVREASQSVAVNLPPDFQASEELVRELGQAARRGLDVRVLASAALVHQLEQTPATLELLARPGLLVSIDGAVAYIGGREPGLTARADGASFATLLETLILGRQRGGIERRAVAAGTSELRPALPAP